VIVISVVDDTSKSLICPNDYYRHIVAQNPVESFSVVVSPSRVGDGSTVAGRAAVAWVIA
jgi:hypothetical protein